MMLVTTNPQRIIIIIIIVIKSSVPLSSCVSRHNKQLLITAKKHCTQPAQHQMAGRQREAGEDSDEPDISHRVETKTELKRTLTSLWQSVASIKICQLLF